MLARNITAVHCTQLGGKRRPPFRRTAATATRRNLPVQPGGVVRVFVKDSADFVFSASWGRQFCVPPWLASLRARPGARPGSVTTVNQVLSQATAAQARSESKLSRPHRPEPCKGGSHLLVFRLEILWSCTARRVAWVLPQRERHYDGW